MVLTKMNSASSEVPLRRCLFGGETLQIRRASFARYMHVCLEHLLAVWLSGWLGPGRAYRELRTLVWIEIEID